MTYYVVSDVHGFYTELISVLKDKGFFEDQGPKKLVLCGDALDRGQEVWPMVKFLLELKKNGELIFIRGNHEDLLVDFVRDFKEHKYSIAIGMSHHYSNGTFHTALQLARVTPKYALSNTDTFIQRVKRSSFYAKLLPCSVDYHEIDTHVFVHGWIPSCEVMLKPYSVGDRIYKKLDNWREASKYEWDKARWLNGMKCWGHGAFIEGKTIVCGHWNASWGNSHIHNKGSEYGEDADFSPFIAEGIAALDAATAYSGKINCLVIKC